MDRVPNQRCVTRPGRVQLFPNWVVRYVRNPNLRLKSWLGVPVEVFIVPPAMTKFEIAEYLKRLYDLPVLKVHTANYLGKMKRDKNGRKFKLPDFKKAYVYLRAYQIVSEAFGQEVQASQLLRDLQRQLSRAEITQADARARSLVANPNCCIYLR